MVGQSVEGGGWTDFEGLDIHIRCHVLRNSTEGVIYFLSRDTGRSEVSNVVDDGLSN